MYTKETHIERSDGDTDYLSVKECPLTDVEVDEIKGILFTDVNTTTPIICCINMQNKCSHFYKFLHNKTNTSIQCSKLSSIKHNELPEYTSISL